MPSFDGSAIARSLKWAPDPQSAGLPPGPTAPAAAQAMAFVMGYKPFLEYCQRRYGDVFTMQLPGINVVWLADPALIQKVFAGNPDELYAGKGSTVLKPIMGEHSLLLVDGERHRRDRRLLMPMFHNDRLKTYHGDMLQKITAKIDRWPVGSMQNALAEMQDLTLEIIIATVFGVTAVQRAATLKYLLKELLRVTANNIGIIFIDGEGHVVNEAFHRRHARWSPVGRSLAAIDRVDRFIYDEIKRRRAEPAAGKGDVLTMLLEARYEDGSSMSDVQIRDELVTLLIAGHETTAASLAWLMWRLWQHPEVRAAIAAELQAVVGDGPLGAEQLRDVPYLDAAIKESLRLTPVIPNVTRHLEVPLTLGRWTLPAGTAVSPAMLLTHARADVWPQPQRYDPTRFRDGGAKPSVFFPFGGGNRTCIGMGFAYVEMKLVVSELVRRVDYRIPRAYRPVEKIRVVTNIPKGGVPFRVTAKR